jgi:hypothetical protein
LEPIVEAQTDSGREMTIIMARTPSAGSRFRLSSGPRTRAARSMNISGTSSTAIPSWNSVMPRMRARFWIARATPSTVVATNPAS